jgi:hypothetical protein
MKVVHRSGYNNQFGDELVVAEGTSDWGELGYFVGYQFPKGYRNERITPILFYSNHLLLGTIIKVELPLIIKQEKESVA